MTKCLQSKLIFMVCLSAMFGLMFSGGAQAQITVSDPVIDATTGGNFEGTYGECFFLLPNPNIDRCEEELGPDSYWTDPSAYRSPSDSGGCFNKLKPDIPQSDHGGPANVCFGNPTAPLNSLPVAFDGFSVDDFRVYRVDNAPDQAVTGVTEPDIAFAWSTIAGPNGGQYASIPCPKTLPLNTDRYATFDSEFVEDKAVTEIVINQKGSIALAYYFVNAADVCRILTFELYINGVMEKSGTFGDFQSGKYLVFEIAGLSGATTIRLETELISDPEETPTICGGSAPIPGVNAHISGVFIDNCEAPPSLCSIGDYVWEDADRDGCQGPAERPIEGVEVKLFEGCGDPTEIASTTTNTEGFYEFTGLDCDQEYRVQFGDAGDIYDYTKTDQQCVDDNPDVSDMLDSDCSQNGGFSGCVTFPDPVNAPDNPTIDCGYVSIELECQIRLTPSIAENNKPGDHTVTAEITCPEDISPAGIEVDFSIVSGPHAGADGMCSPNVDCTTDAGGEVSFTYQGSDQGTDDIQACVTDPAGLNKCDEAVKIWKWPPPDECPDFCEKTYEDGEFILERDVDCTGCDFCFKLKRATLQMDCYECIGAKTGIIMLNKSELRGGTVRNSGVGIKVKGNNNSVIVMRSFKNRRDGIQVAGKYNKIKDSVFGYNGAAGIEVDGANNKIFGNEAFGNADGIKIEDGARANSLYNNALYDNKGSGIRLQDAQNNVVRNNYTESNLAAGIWAEIMAIGNKIKYNYSMDNNPDMKSADPTCSQNTWQSNYFGTSDPGCIR